MGLHFSGEKAQQQTTFEPITPGKYEVILNTEWRKARNGNMYINCMFKIRKGFGQDFENRVTGEENFKLHETKIFQVRGYQQYLPSWAKK